MANPILPGISEAEQELLYKKLNEYNQGRTSYKEAGAYLVVLPRPESPRYSLWVYSPLPERQSIFYVQDLSTDIHESLRAASSLCYYSPRCILLVEYNAKRMQSKGDDIISFGKYHGHFLHEIFRIDPAYVSWIAYKFTPRIPKQERFVQIAQVYHSVHLDIQKRQAHQKYSTSRFLGKEGDKVKELTLKVLRVRLDHRERNDSLFLCPADTDFGRSYRQPRHFPDQLAYGKPGIVSGARYGTCLRARRIGIYCLGTHLLYLYFGKQTIHPPQLCQV